MLFNSIQYLIFFPFVVLMNFLLPQKHRWMFLLAASLYFYMSWNPAYIFLIMLTIVVNYYAALQMDKSSGAWRKTWLTISAVVSLGVLFVFKYFNFFMDVTHLTLGAFNVSFTPPHHSYLLPVGISFYTFQTMSYTIDVYRKEMPVERHFGYFALFVTFFPQLVAGPIERSVNLLPQFYVKHKFDYDRVVSGLRQIAWGLFKKIVVADRAAVIVNMIYNNPSNYNGWYFVIGTLAFAFQIYGDFSGYSDIAIGSGRVMGYTLMKNFDNPYCSRNIVEFWRRWHISLSTWFKDYVYIPLGGNRKGKARGLVNVFLVMLISGVWHGANLTFVLWGAIHGVMSVLSRVTKDLREKIAQITGYAKLPKVRGFIAWGITFSFVCFTWIFFRANTVQDAFYVISKLFTNISPRYLKETVGVIGRNEFITLFCAVVIMEVVQWCDRRGLKDNAFSKKPALIRWGLYAGIVLFIMIFGEFGSQQFIYFQF